MALYGDGTTDLVVPAGGLTLDNDFDFNGYAGPQHFQFRNITINGSLVVPSGTMLRATGDVIINKWITVTRGANDSGGGAPQPGISSAAAGGTSGGLGLEKMQAVMLRPLPQFGGGAGERTANLPASGAGADGRGGGSFMIAAGGNITISGTGSGIGVNGERGAVGTGTADIGGGGGGGGGFLILAAKGSVTMDGNATIGAAGGKGGNGWNGTTGNGAGGAAGGGGGGGVIHIIASAINVPADWQLNVDPGVAGTPAMEGGVTYGGGGGGGSGGNGGNGGSHTTSATGGTAGKVFKTIVTSPETFLIP